MEWVGTYYNNSHFVGRLRFRKIRKSIGVTKKLLWKREQHHQMEGLSTSCLSTPFHWESGIGPGPKQGRNGWALGGCEHPEIPTGLYVCLLLEGECTALNQFLKGLEASIWLRTIVEVSVAADYLGLYLWN